MSAIQPIIEIIGRDAYISLLKQKADGSISEHGLKQIARYEQLQADIKAGQKKAADYLASLGDKKNQYYPTPEQIGAIAKQRFMSIYPYQTTPDMYPVLAYFFKNPKFADFENVSSLSKPSFDKGILIVGGYGLGKSDLFRYLCEALNPYDGNRFKFFTANEVVEMLEQANDKDGSIKEYALKTHFGRAYFDDLTTERVAYTPGKVNALKDVLESRYMNLKDTTLKVKPLTFASLNYPDGKDGDLNAALDHYGDVYGGRLYDRIFEMYNIIEFKGQSFRK